MGPLLYPVLKQSRAVRLLTLLATIAVTLGAVATGAANGISEREVTLAMFGDLTFSLRTPIWAAVVRTIAERPWIGHGFGSFWDVGLRLNPLNAPWNEFFMKAQVINTAHDGYLDQLLQTGMVGFSLGILAIARCLYALQSAAAATKDRLERVALTGLLCLAICIVLNNLLVSYLFRPGDGIGFLFLLIMLLAERARLDLKHERRQHERRQPQGRHRRPRPITPALSQAASAPRSWSVVAVQPTIAPWARIMASAAALNSGK